MKKFMILLGMCSTFLLGYGAMTYAFPAAGLFGRGEYNGYFKNIDDAWGNNVFPSSYSGDALPASINTAAEFINFIKYTQLDIDNNGSSSAREKVGAAFIIQTMISNQSGANRNDPPTAAQIQEWEDRVNYAEDMGRITWHKSLTFSYNSYWQGDPNSDGKNPNDDAFFDQTRTADTIEFLNEAKTAPVYSLKWECANPVGNVRELPNNPNYVISGHTTVSDTTPAPGDTITFHHYVKNEGPDSTSPYTINWAAFRTSPTSYTIATGNGGVFGDGQQKPVRDDPVYIPPGTPGGTQYCERVGWDPIDDNHNRNGRGAIVCATVQYDFDLTPIITTSVNGSPPVAGSVAEVGDNVQFVYQINNGGGTSASVACTIYSNNINGYHPAPNPAESTAGWGTVGGTGCPRIFPAGSTQLPVTDNVTVPASSINKSICRVFTVNPTSFGGGSESVESCIQIGAKPYMRVYGGDVSVGNGQPTACTIANSGVIGWNKETPSYAGAGAQYAVMAIGQINDFASTLGNAAGATAPSSLAFANTTISGANIFGGGYGSLPCIPDYYSRRTQVTTVPLLSTDLSTLTGEQNYTATGPILIGGNINMGQKTVLFVNGDVLITSNITYPASWPASSSPPLFQIIAKGNIFVSQNVTRIDGIYIAQPTTAASTGTGKIITCANTGLPVNPVSTSDTAIYTKCQNALTINGAFVAKDVWFLRTRGSLSQSSAAETNASTNIAEIFNYSPAFWIPQPEGIPSDGGEYDSVTSLPPVL